MEDHFHSTDVERYIESIRHIKLEDRRPEFDQIRGLIERYKPLGSKTRVLEIGSGSGWFVSLCELENIPCRGLEISGRLAEYSRELGASAGVEPDILVGSVEDTEIGTEAYDVVFATSVFEHVRDWRRGLTRIYRALKPGGLFYFFSTNKFSFVSGEYDLPLYGWLPDSWRYALRVRRQGEQIMESGIDYNQFTYIGLRRFFRDLGYERIMDRVDLTDPRHLNNPRIWKKLLLGALRNIPPLKHSILVFDTGTTFICLKPE
jgi:SAM-dependent methyltransferase